MSIKVISLNIWDLPFWFVKDRKKRILRIVEYIKKSEADVVCLQESFDVKNRVFLKDELNNKYRIAGDAFETRRIFFVKLFDVTGGLVVFSKFPIIKSGFIPYSRIFNSTITETIGRKGFLEVVVVTPLGDMKIVDTHMHQETTLFSRKIRLRQTAKMIKKINRDGMPTILAGDFNENYLMEEREFVELFDLTGFSTPLIPGQKIDFRPTYRPDNHYVDNWLNRIRFPKRYDYMFVKNIEKMGLRVTRYEPEYLRPPLSDHDPVVLELSTDSLQD